MSRTINELNTTDTLADGDKFVIWQDTSQATRAITAVDMAEYFGAEPGGPFQPLDELLTAIAGLGPSTANGDFIQLTGQDTVRVRKLTVATYAALTIISATFRFDDMLVYVASRATDGDGGEGWWRFDASSSATANAGTILAPDTGTGRWFRVYTGTINVRWFGAVGNGVANDAAAVQAAFDAVETLGGTLEFPNGVYLFGSQVTLNRTYAASGSNFVGERNLKISGYGAEIRTTGAISALDIRGGWAPNRNVTVEGFTIYHRGNTQAVAGIRMIGAGLVTINEVSVAVSSSLPAGYAAFRMENETASNPDTGCFWNTIERCVVRPWSGAEGYCSFGVELIGAANATTLRQNTLSGSNTHVILKPHAGQTYVSNSVNIDGNFFEGPSTATAIEIVGTASGGIYHVSGTRITNNRFETLLNAVVLSGTGSTVQLPTYMSGNYADTAVTNYLVNTLNIPVVMLDAAIVGSPMGPGRFHNQEGFEFRNDNSSFDTLVVRGPNIGSGLAIHNSSGVRYGRWALQASLGTLLKGRFSSPYAPINLGVIQGISSTDTESKNLTGTVAFASAATRIVTFSITEDDTNYRIFVTGDINETFWVTNKTTTQFTINSSNATSAANVNWFLIR